MAEAARRDGESADREVWRSERAVAHGLKLAAAGGKAAPGLRDAAWELLLEAGDTLKRLPDRERGWLTAAARAHWPGSLSDAVGQTAAADTTRLRLGPASAEAIDHLDTVLNWLPLAAGRNPKRPNHANREVGVLFGLACGLRVARLQRGLGCGRRTIYDPRDRGLARICGVLRERSAYCRGLP
jgi:hypothetical protein